MPEWHNAEAGGSVQLPPGKGERPVDIRTNRSSMPDGATESLSPASSFHSVSRSDFLRPRPKSSSDALKPCIDLLSSGTIFVGSQFSESDWHVRTVRHVIKIY